MNHSNKDGKLSAESGEGRPLIKENARQPNTYPTQSGKGVSQGLAGVRKAAKGNKEMKFTALLHHLTVDLLRVSFYSLKRKAAPGVDGVTWQEYEDGLEDRLTDLHGRIHRGAYRAMPSRRVYIEKEDGRQRPLAIPALEDHRFNHLQPIWSLKASASRLEIGPCLLMVTSITGVPAEIWPMSGIFQCTCTAGIPVLNRKEGVSRPWVLSESCSAFCDSDERFGVLPLRGQSGSCRW
jgi:hypothetical protein